MEVPGSADFDHVEVARQPRWERLVVRVALHDVPNLLIDFRDTAGEFALRLVRPAALALREVVTSKAGRSPRTMWKTADWIYGKWRTRPSAAGGDGQFPNISSANLASDATAR